MALLCNTMPEMAGLSLQGHAAHLMELTASIHASLPILRSDHALPRRSSASVSGPDAYLTRGRDEAAAAQAAGCSKILRLLGMWIRYEGRCGADSEAWLDCCERSP